ncbi:hypothetical protein TrRE_jg6146 [Triparma retinervis]|uniref:Uncharacterized protein n=1 Tax=Triparma retinervis TaxID=2557542 RepID=A0A9W7E431_9STRA|nr:hypothetical protein TrRE_jg6146 [Triparma retinervis]
MADDDPMAFLNAQREKLSAISAMADVASMQNNLVAQVQMRMRSISDIEEGKGSAQQRADPEVEAWKKKIAELSAGGPPPSRADLPKPAPKAGRGGRQQGQPRSRQSGIQAPRARGGGPESSNGGGERSGQSIRRRKSELREINGGAGSSGTSRKKEVRKVQRETSPPPLALTSEASKGLYSSPHRKQKSENQKTGRGGGNGSRRDGARRPPKSPTRSEHPLVRSVEERVEKMPLPSGVDDEVEMWRRKIAELSAVNPTREYKSPIKDTGFSPGSARGSGLEAVKRRASRR